MMGDIVERLRAQILSNATSGNAEVTAIEEIETLRQQVTTLTNRLAEMACVNGILRSDSEELAELRKAQCERKELP